MALKPVCERGDFTLRAAEGGRPPFWQFGTLCVRVTRVPKPENRTQNAPDNALLAHTSALIHAWHLRGPLAGYLNLASEMRRATLSAKGCANCPTEPA